MRTIAGAAFSSINKTTRLLHGSLASKSISTAAPLGNWNDDDDNQTGHSPPSGEEVQRRIFGSVSGSSSGSASSMASFFEKIEGIQKSRNRTGSRLNYGDLPQAFDDVDDSFTTLNDGMDEWLKESAKYFGFDIEEVNKDGYSYRPDVQFQEGATYDIKDLDVRRPGVTVPPPPKRFEVTTEEVLRRADFRNVRFLANFLTEAGIIIKRSQTGISAKAQRKIAREIKTARAFGLMPFTTMGTKSFVFGRSMETVDEDYQYESYRSKGFVEEDPLES